MFPEHELKLLTWWRRGSHDDCHPKVLSFESSHLASGESLLRGCPEHDHKRKRLVHEWRKG